MPDPSIFCAEEPLTNLEREEIWRRKKWGYKLENWWALTHPQDDGIITDEIIGDLVDVPSFLRKQAT